MSPHTFHFINSMQKVAIFGTGYVGLVSGACLARVGNQVTCVDVDEQKIAQLKEGTCPIYEPGLEELLKEGIASGRLAFTLDQKEAVENNDIIMSAVGTPPDEDGSADLQYVLEVARAVAQHANGYKVVVTKSTVPPLTGKKVEAEINKTFDKRGERHDFAVLSNPEFLKEGNAVQDFLKPDRIVIGVDDERAREMMQKLYEPFMRSGYRVIFMDRVSAEMTKYAANAMLATRISFMNEMARLAERVGADIEEIRRGISTDSRIGKAFLYAGPGYGGSCFPKDVKALAHFAKEHDETSLILDAVEDVNAAQRAYITQKVVAQCGGDVAGKKIAVWGLAFKANTDDVRESPAIAILGALLDAGADVVAYDPEARDTFAAHTPIGQHECLHYSDEQYAPLEGANALLILTEWPQFRAPDFARMRELLAKPRIVDARNLYVPQEMEALGFHYASVGRK